MKKMIITAIVSLSCLLVLSQEQSKTATYKHGYNGMEYIIKQDKNTTIVSTFNSKSDIKNEIALKVFDFYTTSSIIPKNSIIIKGEKAVVTGKLIIKKSGLLTSISFFYEKVEWKSGLIEIFTGKNS